MTQEVLKLALEALELHGQQYPHMVKGYCLDAINAIKEALAQPEQEPVIDKSAAIRIATSLGWSPQRTWVGLTDEQRMEMWRTTKFRGNGGQVDWFIEGTRAAETALREALAEQKSGIKQVIELYDSPDQPAQRTWVGLTADELNMIGDRMRTWNSHSLADVYVAIEAKLKQKNGFAEEKNT